MNLPSPARSALAWVLSATLVMNPLGPALAQVTAAGGGTTVGAAGNGVPVVDIAAPNARGLSHNRFTDYNVGRAGLILNNAPGATQPTQLGGLIVGNARLGGTAASLIVNEVTGGRPSTLAGYTEIAGPAARLVVANPWGLACNGCGFLNTPRVTLTTGTPRIEDGRLAGFRVEGGEIAIEGAGLNAGNLDQFDLVTRSARINAALHAQRLNLVTGRNDVAADALSATALAPDGTPPLFALDSTALGGMYAGSIVLLGTEAGVGVRLAGDMAASAGDIRIDAAGRLTIKDAAATAGIAARAASLETQGRLYAGTQLDLAATGDLTNLHTLAARDAVVLASGGTLANPGHVEAGVNPDDSRNAGGDLRLSGQNVRNSGSLLASRDLQADAGQTLDNRDGRLVADRHATVAAARLDNDRGRLTAAERLTLAAGHITNAAGRIAGGGPLAVRASGLIQQDGELYSQRTLTLDLDGGDLDNDGGLISAPESLVLEHLGAVRNRGGEISSVAGFMLAAARLDNAQGRVLSGAGLVLRLDGLLANAHGLIRADGLELAAARLDNAGGTLASDGALGIRLAARDGLDGSLDNTGGLIAGDAAVEIAAARLDNRQGRIEGQGTLALDTGLLDNTGGSLVGLGRVTLAAGHITNAAGRIASGGPLAVRASGLDQPGGELYSQRTLTLDLDGGDLDNDGALINAAGALTLKNLGAVRNRGGEISSVAGFMLAAAGLDNAQGRLLSGAGLVLRLDDLLGNAHGLIRADSLELAAARADNAAGRIASRGDLAAAIGELRQADGELLAEGALTLTGHLLDNRGGRVAANGGLWLAIDAIDNRGGDLSTRSAAAIQARRLDNGDAGHLLAAGLDLDVLHLLNRNQGLIHGRDAARVTGARLDNDGGTLAGGTALTVDLAAVASDATLDGRLNNAGGRLDSDGTLTLSAVRIDNLGGTLSSAGDLRVSASGALSNAGGYLLTDAALRLRSAGLDNREGRIAAKGALDLGTGAVDNTRGHLTAGGRLDLVAGALTNTAGRIASAGPLALSASGLLQPGGELFSQRTLTLDLHGGDLDNDDGLIRAPDVLVLQHLGAVRNRGGEIASAAGFELAATALDNAQGRLLSEAGLALRIDGRLGNAHGLISASRLALAAGRLDNAGGTLHARGELGLTVAGALDNRAGGLIQAGQGLDLAAGHLDNRGGRLLAGQSLDAVVADTLDNRDGGLVNSQGGLALGAAHLDSSAGGEVSAKGDMQLSLGTLVQQHGVLIGEAALGLVLGAGGLDNQGGLIGSRGALALASLGALDNRGGEISGLGALTVSAPTLDNRAGRLISRDRLALALGDTDNQGGLLSGWLGLVLTGGDLDNRQFGTVSSRSGDLALTLAGELLNSGQGALAAAGRLELAAAGVDNREQGLLSSGAGQRLTVDDTLDNRGGQIDSGAALALAAARLDNRGGLVLSAQALEVTGGAVDNAGGRISAAAAARLGLSGAFGNAGGQLASGGPLAITAGALDNRGGTLASRSTLDLDAATLDNTAGGTLAANGALGLAVAGLLDNRDDGLIDSRDATVHLAAGALDNAGGTLQGQGDLALVLGGDLRNAGGTVVSRTGDVDVRATHLDNRQGTLASIEGWVRTVLSGGLNNGEGGLIQGERLALAAGTLSNDGGRIHALGGDARLSAAALDNRHGVLYARDTLRFAGGAVDNRGGRLGAGAIALLLSGALDNRQGLVESGGTLAVTGTDVDNQGGQLRALGTEGETSFRLSGSLDNRDGALETANADLTLAVGDLANEGGSLLHAGEGELRLAPAQIAQAGGTLVTRGGLDIVADTWHNRSVLQAARLRLDVGTLSQSAGGQLLATESFTGSGADWTHDGLIASDGTLSLTLTGGYGGSGRLTSLGTLSLAAARLDLTDMASIAGGGQAVLALGGQADNRGRITAAGDMALSAAALTNRGTLGSAGRLTLSTPALLNEGGLIFSGGDMALQVGRFTNRHADVYSLGDLGIASVDGSGSATAVENPSGTIESAGDMHLRALSLENTADAVETERQLISGAIAVRCFDCSNDHYTVDYYVRETYQSGVQAEAPASLTAGGHFDFVGGTFVNRLSTVAAGGDLSIDAAQFSNEGGLSGTIERTRIYGGHDQVKDGRVKRFVEANVVPYNLRNSPDFPNAYYVDDAGNLRLAKAEVVEKAVLSPDVGWVHYRELIYSDMETGRVLDRLQAASINYSTGFSEYLEPIVRWVRLSEGQAIPLSSQYDPNNLLPLPADFDSLILTSDVEVATATGGGHGYAAVIQAGGNVAIAASQNLNNGVINAGTASQPGTRPTVDTTPAAVATTVVQLNPQLPPDLAQQQVNPLTLPGFSLPSGQNGLFRLNGEAGRDTRASAAPAGQDWTLSGATLEPVQRGPAVPGVQAGDVRLGDLAVGGTALPASSAPVPGTPAQPPAADSGTPLPRAQGVPVNTVSQPHKYLIETNPALTELTAFLGSDYLLGRLGEDGDTAWRRLGDGLYEQRLVQQAVVARTGQRFLAGLDSDEATYRYLMDNALASKAALNLSVGVSLTAGQVAALTHDIVWLETVEVNGERVLAPVLYLAQAEGRLGPTGALIQGQNLDLIAGGTLANRGTLRATGDLSASATTVLNAGLMEAGERLSVLGGDSVANTRGGILAGRDVDVTALDGDLINERTVTHVDGTASRLTFTVGLADSAARIEALGSLSLSAGRDLYNLGGVISAIADLDLSAGRDLVIAAAEERDDSLLRTRRRTHRIESVTQYGGAVSAGGDLTAVAGQDLSVIGSRVEAGGDATLLAGNDLTLSSAADASHEDERDRRRGKKLHQATRTVRQQAAEVEAGGDLTLAAGQDLTLVASTASAGREAYLYAGRDVALLAQTDQDAFLYDKKSKGGFGSRRTRHDEVNVVTQVGSSVSAGTDLTVESGGDQRYQVANLKSGQDLTLDAGGGIAFEGAKDFEQAIHEKSDSDWAWTSAKGKGKTDETLRQSELIAGGELAIRAAEKIRIDVPEVNAHSVSQTIDALVQAEPQLAWLKEMERRGDIDWQRVKEVHERFQYSQSGMGPGLTLVTAIVVTALTWGTVSAWLGTGAAAGSAMVAAVPATATAAGVSAGWANAALTATVTSMASNAAIHTLNSGGDLGKALENTFSERAMKGYLTSAVVAGLMTGLVDRYFKGEGGSGAGVEGDVSQAGQATASTSASGFNLDTAAGIGQFAAYQGTRALVSAGVDTAINGGNFEEKLGAALTLAAVHTVSAVAFHEIGDLKLQDGSIEKVAVKALVGGLISQAATGDFATGALAAGANEALVKHLADLADHDPQLTGMASQLVGAVSSAISGGDPNLASNIALSDTQYNYLSHQETDQLLKGLRECGGDNNCKDILLKDAIALSSSRSPHELLDPSLNRDAAFAEQMLQWAASGLDYGMISQRRLNELASINADHRSVADNTPVLTSGTNQEAINQQTMLNSWHYGQSASLSEGWLAAGPGSVAGAGLRLLGYGVSPVMQAFGTTSQAMTNALQAEVQLLRFGYQNYVIPAAMSTSVWLTNPTNVQNVADFVLSVTNWDPSPPTSAWGLTGTLINSPNTPMEIWNQINKSLEKEK
ncbi:two-partner secretion domain-containing protein [Thauera sinica]|nr:DUF637 domain-containing protein [Thauera sp. K11]